MNVKIAAQTLSVASAIDFANFDMQLEQFSGSEDTTTFIRNFDEIFDICNSSNPCAKGYKQPLTVQNMEAKFKALGEAICYILELKDPAGKSIVIGFICSMKSIMALADYLFKTRNFFFLFTYRLSQDHLETFFSRIRRLNGWNNNPTPLQFQWSLRALLLKNQVLPLSHANCIEADNRLFGEPGKPTKSMFLDKTPELLMEFVEILQRPSVYHEQAPHYISGFICRKLAERSKCNHCSQVLSCSQPSPSKTNLEAFTRRRDKGGLIYSADMFIVIQAADKCLRHILTGPDGPSHLSRQIWRIKCPKACCRVLEQMCFPSCGVTVSVAMPWKQRMPMSRRLSKQQSHCTVK